MHHWTSRHWNLFSLLCLLAATGWIALTAPKAPPAAGIAPQSGFIAPGFSLPDASGKIMTLESYNGQAIVLNFWASWCEPCKQEMPALEKAFQNFSSRGVMIIGINMTNSDSLANARQFAAAQGLSFPVLFDENGKAGGDYRVHLLPTTFFIGQDGLVRKVVSGGMSESFILSTIEELLVEDTP